MRGKAAKRTDAPSGDAVAPVVNPVNGNVAAVKDDEAKTKEARPPFWEFIHSLNDRWATEGIVCYAYRLLPVIDRRETEHFLAKFTEDFDEDTLLRNFGSGKYLLQCNNGRGKTLHRRVVSLHNLDFPPRVNPEEIVASDPRNEVYLRTWAKKPDAAAGQGNKESSKGETAEILREVFEKGAKIDPTLVELWKEASSQRDALAKLLAEQKQTAPAPPPPQPNLLEILTQVKQLQGDPLFMLGKLKEFFPSPKERELSSSDQAPPDPLDNLQKMLAVFEKARDMFKPEATVTAPVAAAPDAELWEKLSIILGNQISGIMASVPGIIAAWKGGPVPPPRTVATPQKTGAFNPYDQAAMRDYVRAQTASAAPAAPSRSAPTPATPGSQPQVVSAQFSMPNTEAGVSSVSGIEDQVVGLITSALNCMNRGIGGHEFADSLIVVNGELGYEAIVSQIQRFTIPGVLTLAKNIPQINDTVIAYENQFARFIAEFVEGPPAEEDDDGNEEVEVAASEAPPKLRKKAVTVA
jgi:hypothetical protein